MNKLLLKHIALIFFLVISFVVNAQIDLPEDSFVVVKEYEPVLSDAIKIKDNPVINDTEKIEINLKYDFLNVQYPAKHTVEPIKPARVKGEPLVKLYRHYLTLGFGSNTTPLFDYYYNTKRNKNMAIGLHAKHFSTNGIAKIDYDDRSSNTIELYAKRYWKHNTLKGAFNYNREVVHYYGFLPQSEPVITDKDGIKQRYNTFGGLVEFSKNYTDTSEVNYKSTLAYYNLSDLYSSSENNFKLDAYLGKLQNSEWYKVNLLLDYNSYQAASDSSNNLILGLSPHISTQSDNWKFDAGIALFLNAGDKSTFHFYPMAEFKYNLVEDIIIPYLGINGKIQRNSFKTISIENPFINASINLQNTNVKRHLYAGIRGSLSKKMTFYTSVNLKRIATQPFFIKKIDKVLDNTFDVIYDTLNLTSIEGELAYQQNEKIKWIASGAYYLYKLENLDNPYHLPNFKFTATALYDLRDKIIAKLDIFVIGDRPVASWTGLGYETKILPLIFDANLMLEYRYTKKLSAFISFNNIASQQYQIYQDYNVQQFNVLGGLKYSF
ncbi:MAG: hypothetical protein Kow0079_06080 [Vicingaceae bacterium]